jgi:hypothetical protein
MWRLFFARKLRDIEISIRVETFGASGMDFYAPGSARRSLTPVRMQSEKGSRRRGQTCHPRGKGRGRIRKGQFSQSRKKTMVEAGICERN